MARQATARGGSGQEQGWAVALHRTSPQLPLKFSPWGAWHGPGSSSQIQRTLDSGEIYKW